MTTQRQQVSIPADWDSESWSCYQVEWPDSPEWRSLLRGLLSLTAGGRFWKDDTGSIKGAQSVGREIIGRNIPLVDCAGQTIVDPLPPEKQVVVVGLEDEEFEMGWLCGVNPESFRISADGKLEVRSFCGEWVTIGGLTSPSEIVDGDVWPVEDPPATYYACGKVAMLQKYMLALSNAAWENWDNPETIEAAMRAAVPMATLSRARIYQWVAQIASLDAIGGDQTLFDIPDTNQKARCQAVQDVAATAIGTGDERGAVVEAMASAYYNDVGLFTKAQWQAYWHFVTETIGDQDSRLILALGATDSSQDCSCPGLDGTESWPNETDWYIDLNFQGALPSYVTLNSDNGQTYVTPLGLALFEDTIGSDKVGFSWSPPVTTGTLTRVKLFMLADDAWIAANPWVGLGMAICTQNNQEGSIIGTNGIYTYENTSLSISPALTYAIAEANADVTKNPIHVVMARMVIAGTGAHPLGL